MVAPFCKSTLGLNGNVGFLAKILKE